MDQRMTYLRFFFVNVEKMPVRAVRKDKAFINAAVPNVFAFLTKDGGGLRDPDRSLWNGLKPKPFPMHPYPKIDPTAWFTYKKNGDGKVRRVTLADYEKKIKRRES